MSGGGAALRAYEPTVGEHARAVAAHAAGSAAVGAAGGGEDGSMLGSHLREEEEKAKAAEAKAAMGSRAGAAQKAPILNAPGCWDVFISYTQQDPQSKSLAPQLYTDLMDAGLTVWLDRKMSNQVRTLSLVSPHLT